MIPSSFEKSLFVDDFSNTSRNMDSIERQLHLCLSKVDKWAWITPRNLFVKQLEFVNCILLVFVLDEVFFYYKNAYRQFWF